MGASSLPIVARAHDCLINVQFGDTEQPDWIFRVKDEYFKQEDSIFAKWEMSKVLDEMDANGVQRAVLTGNVNELQGSPIKFVEARPDRFALSVGASSSGWRPEPDSWGAGQATDLVSVEI